MSKDTSGLGHGERKMKVCVVVSSHNISGLEGTKTSRGIRSLRVTIPPTKTFFLFLKEKSPISVLNLRS